LVHARLQKGAADGFYFAKNQHLRQKILREEQWKKCP
jgi:hypothetical protein